MGRRHRRPHHGASSLAGRNDGVAVGEGIDGLLGNLVRLLVGRRARRWSARPGAYPTFAYHVAGFGGRLLHRPLSRRRRGSRGAAARRRARPARRSSISPTPTTRWGAGIPAPRIARDDRAACPAERVLCLDEAYADFAPADALPPLDPDEPRVIRMRTFSKAHGMAGARIGYAIGHPELIAAFDRVRNHFGVNGIAVAGALASLADPGWLAQVVAEVAAARDADRRDRGGERARGAAVGDELRRGRLRPRRRLRAAGARRAARPRHLRAQARGGAAGPLHPGRAPAGPADLDAFAAALPEALAAAG